MNELIEINQMQIGTENVNSVNARDLHINLEIKKDFSNWIKAQIRRAGLRENVDYITLALKGERESYGLSHTKIEYILTLDSAKHISMMSQGKKAQEIRDYFIEAEKKLVSKSLVSQDLSPAIVEMQKTNQAIIESNQQIVSHLTQMNSGLHEMLATMMNTKHEVSQIKKTINDDRRYMRKLDEGLDNIGYQLISTVESIKNVLKPEELDHIRTAIDKRAKEISLSSGEKVSTITRTIYSYLNGKFDISSYYHLQSSQFLKALKIIEEINIK